MSDRSLPNQEMPAKGLKIESVNNDSPETVYKNVVKPIATEIHQADNFNTQGSSANNEPKDNQEEKIVLDIGEISEIAPGRGHRPGPPLTGNFFIDSYRKLNNYVIGLTKIDLREKTVFYQLLATMIDAGVSIIKALDILSQQTRNPKLKKVAWDVSNQIEKGSSFSEAISVYPNIFSEAEIGMIASGEAAGRLFEVLTQLAKQSEKSANLVNKIKGALMYPIVIVCILIIAMFVMLTVVIPKLSALFTASGKELPRATQIVLNISAFLTNHWLAFIIALLALILFFMAWKKTENGKYEWDALKLKFPIFGRLYRDIALARFARALSGLLLSGIPIIKALEIDANAVGHEIYREKLLAAADDISRGIPLGENLSGNDKIFPPMVVYMIAVGEKTAQIGEMSAKIADFYEMEVETMTQGFMKLIEPLIIAVLGVVIGGLILAIMQPILQLSDISEGM